MNIDLKIKRYLYISTINQYSYLKNRQFTYKDIHKILLIIVNNENQFCLERIQGNVVNKEIFYNFLDNYIHINLVILLAPSSLLFSEITPA
jgi:hypothetical protein